MTVKYKNIDLAVIVFAGFFASAQAATLFSDDFNRAGSLNGSSVDANTGPGFVNALTILLDTTSGLATSRLTWRGDVVPVSLLS